MWKFQISSPAFFYKNSQVYPLLLIGYGAVRTEMQELGGDPNPINPLSQIDLNIAHSI